MVKKLKKFRQGLTIKQVGAIKSGKLYRLGKGTKGGLFTKQEILKSRARLGTRMGIKFKKSAVGL